MDTKKIYCSLDIETSGFDPLVNEILEVGFCFFEVEKKGIKIIEEWTQVFSPDKSVSPQILGLTGITQKELDEAPKFLEFKEFLQKKLGKAIIVGHNIGFDIKFLETFGVRFSGGQIDTLDLVQWLLPTHHSYNLENLMHTFGISHKEAHRALADSKAVLILLEKLLGLYNGFNSELQNEICKLVKKSDFIWGDLLDNSFTKFYLEKKYPSKIAQKLKNIANKNSGLNTNTIYNFGIGENYIKEVAGLAGDNEDYLLVVPKTRQALDLYKEGVVEKAIFSEEVSFDEKKFQSALKKKTFSPEEIRFLLKVLVWFHTNWQTESITDLNLSFFGGQFKGMITGGKIKEQKYSGKVVCDMEVFLHLAENNLYTKNKVVICGLNEFENTIVSNVGTKTSWGYVNYILKSYYNSETQTGDKKFSDAVQKALIKSDLFFGLTSALLQSDPPGFVYFKFSPQTEYDERFVKIKAARIGFVEKLTEVNEVLKSKELALFLNNFENFFQDEPNRVRWIELAENRCAFLSMPLDINLLVQEAIKKFSQISFADELPFGELLDYFVKRLGLVNYKIENHPILLKSKKNTSIFKQGDLFSSTKKAFGLDRDKIKFHIWPKAVNLEELQELFGNVNKLPAVILFPNQTMVREFYEANYEKIKKKASLLAQSSSGGSNKIFRNFSINSNSLLLATDKFILRSTNNNQAVDPVCKLSVKTLIICRLPFEQFTHPYQEAVSQSFNNGFMDYSLPKALLNFHSLMKFFYTPYLKNVYIIDAKLAKEYAEPFINYYKSVPGAEI